MAKKSRRARRRQKARKARPTIPAAPPPTAVASAVPRREVRPAREKVVVQTTTDFSAQYAYVRQDLKRIGLLAGTIFAALIGLSFFLR